MEWKWVKSLLIFFFILLNCFLGYKVYQRNTASLINSDTIISINTVLSSRNITCDFNLSEVEVRKYMRKINISNDKNIEEKFVPMSGIDVSYDGYSGRNREILSLPVIITNFIRDTKCENTSIVSIVLGYYPEMSQIDKNVLSGEATPAWLIKLGSGEEYIYNAYLGERMN